MLRNRIFLVIAIGLVPVAIAAVLGVYAVNDSHRTDVARLESAALTETAASVQNFMTNQILGQTSILVPYGSGIAVATSAQEFALQNRLASLPYLASLSFVDTNGMELIRLDRAHPSGVPSSTLQNVASAPAYQAARAGNYFVGDVAYGPSGPSVSFATPFKNNDGDVVGVVMGTADLGNVQTIVAQAKIGETGYLYLVDANGNMIAGGGPFASLANDGAGATSTAGLAVVQKVTGGADLLSANDQTAYANAFGTPVVAAAKYLPGYGWGLVAEWPTAEANAVVNDLFARSATALAIVLVIMFGLSLFLAAYVVRPVRRLKESAERVAEGKFDQGVLIRTGDELQALGDSFNTMVQGLKRLEELKDEFVFVAAHELKTPVAAMKGYLSLILDGTTGAITPQTKAYIDRVLASDDRLVQLVGDLLEVARSQAGRLAIKVAPIDLAPPIASTLDELKSLADAGKVQLVYRPDPALPQAVADADRVKEVMVNLVGNAIKYMGGAGTVTVAHEVKGDVLVTHVADTGLGMSKEAQDKLFTKFYRIQTEKTRDITGTGLGLFIVKMIIEKMGGTIWVESEEGKGSTFSFALPCAAPGDAGGSSAGPAPSSGSA